MFICFFTIDHFPLAKICGIYNDVHVHFHKWMVPTMIYNGTSYENDDRGTPISGNLHVDSGDITH